MNAVVHALISAERESWTEERTYRFLPSPVCTDGLFVFPVQPFTKKKLQCDCIGVFCFPFGNRKADPCAASVKQSDGVF